MGFTIGYTCAMATTPRLWLVLCCEEWGTPRTLAERTWQALQASRWTQPTALRQWVLVQFVVDPGHFRQTYSPLAVVDVLETLVKERRLTRRQASALEDYLLTTVTPEGAWRPERGHPHADHARLQSPCELYEAR